MVVQPLAGKQSSGLQLPSIQPPPALPGQASGSDGQAKLILGSFQAIVMPFNPSMIGSIIGANPGSGLPQQIPTLPTIGSSG